MFFRSVFLAGFTCLALLCGCSSDGAKRGVDDPPPFKFKNFERLAEELAWFYADAQDMFFGVDYYADIEARFGDSPYQ